MAKSAKVAKNFATGGLPGVTGEGSNFEQGNVAVKNGSGPGGASGSSSYPGGKGAIGNGSGIPDGAK